MNDTTKTGESRQVLQKCIKDLLAERTRERKFRAEFSKFVDWIKSEYDRTTETGLPICKWSEYDLSEHETLWRVFYVANKLKEQHIDSGKETEGERNAMPE